MSMYFSNQAIRTPLTRRRILQRERLLNGFNSLISGAQRSVMQKTESVKQPAVSTVDITKPSSRSGHGATKPRPPLKPRDLAQRSVTWTQTSGVEQLPTCGTTDNVKCVTTSEDDVETAATASVSTADECSTFDVATSEECSPSNKAILRRRSARPRLAPPPPPPKKPTAESQHKSQLTDSQSR
ncbi:unnamed protein product [Angiostrongylus costaricensis]|uniref:Uncharacterized protein n=1 Tax=Angiostrongylus costaricensis TaxID=334426 RepID=A0A0R3PBP3_ANGCS|nr:unnamed protein product [Angiostrongylus costaricensis]